MVERYDITSNQYFGFGIGKTPIGTYVKHSDYEALEARCRELEAELESASPRRKRSRWL